jgi:hypothetical protein
MGLQCLPCLIRQPLPESLIATSGPDKDDEAADAWIKAAEILIVEGATIFSITHSPYSDDTRARGSSHGWGSWDARLQSEGDKEKRTVILKVDRIKEHDSSGQWGFTLEEQEVEEHPGEFSLGSTPT